ncbi:hypothetical protein DIE04_28195 [Burkholderia sp. Bp8994]|nr:hypothetical protein DIE20_33785 [Burkholderia sp. Bp9131]RQR63474.1 hypothetical protein DIE12_33990 [Burkholderia sp. Bp9015]RQR72708.1 hypothetical protein DIE10_33120 [Burkholderia sp. Bp9011]RQR84688.1 hypothetical protein DIE09_33745 [Burkholderia sp. Bp9010]RQR90029.1 hypothetical protein DIE04_28195 [Burkholderia sp. Bp8994]RQS19535.1 hypothetical protein DIE05_34660 [Burkholderia sp. Bp8995]RQS30887.1 hypothetical protein DIE01_33265 [Burkholderia sp. Bp8990]RQS39202.1 hypothetic
MPGVAHGRRCRRYRLTPPAPRLRAPEPAILKMPACRVLARLRTRHDDFSIYQGYRRYAEIVAARAPNAQDARIFAT